ncbi:conserved hypothetical protein [Gloeothece citriformis PCC 7424]|uniref:Uncharacterized protein n=1 Tax=Gloeothece citriformis (strain PCC 7424) TaxID=65393 RepID=B7KJS3_GLOC7|nr:MFS transporter [Gloeothece citriformis]ACK69522.1 conserved hypothetical protein [Gloeothece citriformis PCC 7424]
MISSGLNLMGFILPSFWLAQAPVIVPEPTEAVGEAAENAALVFSGPQFFSALIAGVVLAFAIQLLLTNFGVAVGISMAGGKSSDSDRTTDRTSEHHESLGRTIRKIGWAVGLGTLISVTIALFFASLLAVRLSLFVAPGAGAIVGLVIWATYFCLLVWISSTTVNSFIGSIINTATSGFQAIWGTAASVIGAKAASKQVIDTAEATVAAVRRELGAAIDPVSFRENLEDYLDRFRPPELDWHKIRSDFENLLKDPNLQELVTTEGGVTLDRQAFVNLISDRSDLSKRDVNRLADQLEAVWNKATSNVPKLPSKNALTQLGDYLMTATRDQLLGSDFAQKLEALVDEMRQQRKASHPSPLTQSLTSSLNALMGMVMGRTDLSDLDVEKIGSQIQKLQSQLGEQTNKLSTQVGLKEPPHKSAVQSDIENYLLNAYPWQLQRKNLNREFRDLLYDPLANPELMASELEQISRSDFVDLLAQKGLLTQTEIEVTANRLEQIRLEVLQVAREQHEQQCRLALLKDVEQFILNIPQATLLNPERLQAEFMPVLEAPDTDYDTLSSRLAMLDRQTLERLLLQQRGDITPEMVASIVPNLEATRDRVLQESHDWQNAIKAKGEQQWLKLQSYLRDTGKDELNPQAIEQDLKLLLHDPQAGAAALRSRASRFDRDTLVQLLSQRQDLSEQQINDILNTVERNWTRIRYAPQKLTGKALEQYNQVSTTLADYLRNTGKEELNPEGIQRDLRRLLQDPQAGATAIRQRLAMMDRDTLVQLLSQREDLSEEQINQVIDEVMGVIHSVVNAPRYLARRTQQQVQNFQSALADYLRSTERSELNPEGIQRDIRILLNDPRLGMETLQERLSQVDRDTLVALLSQREDMTEEEANRIIDNILSVRDRFVEQIRNIQYKVQDIIDGILDRIRAYLNGLERPELNYEGLTADLRQLFDDPQAGFEALRDRFSHVNRDTLIAVLSSREDISQADAERIVGSVERTRDRILQRAERIQQQAQLRLEQAKEQAQHQVEETRKAAAAASWWLFLTALISGIAAAGAGALGVVD